MNGLPELSLHPVGESVLWLGTIQVWGRPPACRFTESLAPCPSGRRNTGPEARLTGRPEVCPTFGPEPLLCFLVVQLRFPGSTPHTDTGSLPTSDKTLWPILNPGGSGLQVCVTSQQLRPGALSSYSKPCGSRWKTIGLKLNK